MCVWMCVSWYVDGGENSAEHERSRCLLEYFALPFQCVGWQTCVVVMLWRHFSEHRATGCVYSRFFILRSSLQRCTFTLDEKNWSRFESPIFLQLFSFTFDPLLFFDLWLPVFIRCGSIDWYFLWIFLLMVLIFMEIW